MSELFKITHDPAALLSGTENKVAQAYIEAAQAVSGPSTDKSLDALQQFARSIENVMKQSGSRDQMVAMTKGNISRLKNYQVVENALKYLKQRLPQDETVKALNTIHDFLKKSQSIYTDGYTKKVKLIVLEYESLAIMLVKGITVVTISKFDCACDAKGNIDIKLVSNKMTGGLITKTVQDMAKQISKPEHTKYLNELIKLESTQGIQVVKEYREEDDPDPYMLEAFTEATGDTVQAAASILGNLYKILKYGGKVASNVVYAAKMIVKTAFGIKPLIRSAVYIYYKRKVDLIQALEMQAQFIELNIAQVKNRTDLKEKDKAVIIKKQQAYVEAYQKKAEKLRAELLDGEQDAKKAMDSDTVIREKPKAAPASSGGDDEFTL